MVMDVHVLVVELICAYVMKHHGAKRLAECDMGISEDENG